MNKAPPVFFQGYRLTNVYGRIDDDEADAVIAMWLEEQVVPEPEARRRCKEVVYTIHDPDGRLVGVNTVYVSRFRDDGPPYYFYRTFIRPRDRGRTGLARTAMRLTLAFLERDPDQARPRGLVAVTENPKLMRQAAMRIIADLGFELVGQDRLGRNIWCYHFGRADHGMSLPEAVIQEE